MQYTLDIQSPDYELMLTFLQSYSVTLYKSRHEMRYRYGATSPQARQAQELCLRADRIIAKLTAARATATPERAVQRSESLARNAGDEMRVVYGRPRNDPRDARTGEKRMPRK